MTTAKDPEQIREEIDETRRELGDTVEALAAKADVKTQVHRQLESTKASARSHRTPIIAAAGACVAVLLVWRLSKR
jgi:type VI protein secretion system component VasF